MTPYSMWTKERLIKELQYKLDYIAQKECQIFLLSRTCNDFAKDLQETIDTAAEMLKEYRDIADSAHQTAQWTLDANHRQVEHLKSLNTVLTEILNGLTEKMPIAKKISQYDSIANESWTIEVPDQYEYSRFFDWVDENLARWKASTVGGIEKK